MAGDRDKEKTDLDEHNKGKETKNELILVFPAMLYWETVKIYLLPESAETQ